MEYRLRSGVAYAYMMIPRTSVPLDQAIDGLKEAIKYNPYAADLHANLLKLYGEKKDGPNIQKEFDILKRLVPQSFVVKQLEQAGFK